MNDLRWVNYSAIFNSAKMDHDNKTTLVLGASLKPHRYSHKAIRRLLAEGHEVRAVGLRAGQVEKVSIETGKPAFEDIHTVTLYMNGSRQQEFHGYILSLNPQRIIFNPGAGNPELVRLAEEKGIQAIEACTLVLLATGEY